jgi:hypothetical protein
MSAHDDSFCFGHGHDHHHGPGAKHYDMEDMRRFGTDWIEAALSQKDGDISRVQQLLVPTMGTWVNYGHMMTMAMVGAVLTAGEMFSRAGLPGDAECVLVAEQRDPMLEPSAVERLAVKMIASAGNRDFPVMHESLKAFCPMTPTGIHNLMEVQAEILSTYRMVVECH